MKILFSISLFVLLLSSCISKAKETPVLSPPIKEVKMLYAEKNIHELIALAPAKKRFRTHGMKPSVYLETGEVLEKYLFAIEAGELLEKGKNHAVLIVETGKDTISFNLFEFNKRKNTWEFIDSIQDISLELAALDIKFEDCTFNGLKDMLLIRWYSLGGIGTHYFYLISLDNKQLKRHPSFKEIQNPVASSQQKRIFSTRNIMCKETASWNVCTGEWFWENDALKLKEEKCLCDEEEKYN